MFNIVISHSNTTWISCLGPLHIKFEKSDLIYTLNRIFGEWITQISSVRWNFGRVTVLNVCFSVKTRSTDEWLIVRMNAYSSNHAYIGTFIRRMNQLTNEWFVEWLLIRRMNTYSIVERPYSSNERLIRRMSMNKHCLFDDFTDWLIRQTHSSNDSMCSQIFDILHLNTRCFTKINLMTVEKTIFVFFWFKDSLKIILINKFKSMTLNNQ